MRILDILLNVFLAIAVDNLADAESLTAIEKEEEVFKLGTIIIYYIIAYFVTQEPENQQKSRSNSQSIEREDEYQGENSESSISVEEELSEES